MESDRGSISLELALLAPLLLLLLTGVTEIGLAVHDQMTVQHAAEAGARYAVSRNFDPKGVAAAVAAASALPIEAQPVPQQFCGCLGASAIVTAIRCGTLCRDGTAPASYVSVSAQMSRRSILTSALPLPAMLASTVMLRRE